MPDADILDLALLGVSDEGCAVLVVEAEWEEKSVIDSVMNPLPDVGTMSAINSLGDMLLLWTQLAFASILRCYSRRWILGLVHKRPARLCGYKRTPLSRLLRCALPMPDAAKTA
ncbi:MAG: hypothetical protein ACJAZO_003935 [Myxococcota bacterium]